MSAGSSTRRFGPGASAALGKPLGDVGKALAAGRATASRAKREAAYAQANNAIRGHVPMIPVARTGSTAAFLVDVGGAVASPLRLERFAAMTPGDRRQLVWLTSGEPPGLYCADETDPVALLVCSQLVESLYAYQPGGAAVVPGLAERCAPNAALTVWTCTLRSGVVFHDGSRLDAGDVLTSFAVQWDAEDPRHLGRTGTFADLRRLVRRVPARAGGPGGAGRIGAARRLTRSWAPGGGGQAGGGAVGGATGGTGGAVAATAGGAADARERAGPWPAPARSEPSTISAKWQATSWPVSSIAQHRVLGRAALRVAELLAQPAAGVEAAARRRVRPATGRRP